MKLSLTANQLTPKINNISIIKNDEIKLSINDFNENSFQLSSLTTYGRKGVNFNKL